MEKKTMMILIIVLLFLFIFAPACIGSSSIQNEEQVAESVTDIGRDVQDIGNTLDEIDQAFG